MIAGLVPSPEIGAQLHQLMASPTGFAASWIEVDGVSDYLRAA
jgi:hypothetical protein